MQSKKRPKSQHYVPRFYLKEFSIHKGSKFQIDCHRKENGETFRTNIENIGQENGFYDYSTDDYIISIEENLAQAEGNIKPVYKKLVDKRNLDALTEEEKIVIATFAALQMLRTPEQRIIFDNMQKQLEQRVPGIEKSFGGFSDEKNKLTHMSFIMDNVVEFSGMLMMLKWVLVTAPKNSYWTSDNPVFKYNSKDFGPYGNLGLLCSGIQVNFPLSHDLLLIMYDGKEYTHIKSNLIEATTDGITFYNYGQTINSIRHIFGRKTNFQLAEKILVETPEFRDPDRVRMELS